MAWFGTNRNTGAKAYGPWSVDPDKVKYAVVDYSASTYVSESEQVIQYKGPPTIHQEYYDKHNPGKVGLLREEPHFGPWRSPHDEKVDEFFPRAQVGHRSRNPAHDQRPKKGDEFSPRADHVGHEPWSVVHDHAPKKDNEFSPRAQVRHQPWSTTHDRGPKKGEGLSPKAHVQVGNNPNNVLPRGTHVHARGSPPSRNHYNSPNRERGKYNKPSDESDNDDYGHASDDDDVVCEDGVCYRKGSKPKPNNNHLKRQDYNHDKERSKLGHSYSPPTSYTSVPKKDPYHEKSYPKDNQNDPQLHKGNDPPYKVPMITTSPRNGYEQPNNTHHPSPTKTRVDAYKAMDPRKDHSPRDSPRSGALPQPQYGSPRNGYEQSNNKTRIDEYKAMDPQKDHSPRDSPRFGAVHQPQYGSPRKEYQDRTETIDSAEARRKYATAAPRGGVNVEENYAGTIDSYTAARKYKGVFVPNW